MPKNPENVELKDKVVEFKLSAAMRLPDLIKIGYQRKEIVELFAELEKKGFGMYMEGSRGKTNCATFEFFEKNPETYRMTFKVGKLHKDYVGKPEEIKVEDKKAASSIIPASISGNQGIQAVPGATEYYCFLDNDTIRLRKIPNGAGTIEGALQNMWDQIEERIVEPHYNNMTIIETVASKLRGFGYYRLGK